MASSTRTTWLKVVALVVALASLTINFGLIDLIDGYTGYIDQARNQVLDAGWGLVFGVILPLGLLAQLHRPERRIAGIRPPTRPQRHDRREGGGGTLELVVPRVREEQGRRSVRWRVAAWPRVRWS